MTPVSNHNSHQISGAQQQPRPPCKFHNHWTISTPAGWSCLFVAPLNRSEERFEVFSGVVDTDTYQSPIHFPFVAKAADGVHVIAKGTPLVQVIPFKRDAADLKASIRPETAGEAARARRIMRQTEAGDGWYREHARARR